MVASSAGSNLARSWLKQQQAIIAAAAAETLPVIATVTGVSGDLVTVQTAHADTGGGQLFACAAGPDIVIGDVGLLLPLAGGSAVFIKTGGQQGIQVRDDTTIQGTATSLVFGAGLSVDPVDSGGHAFIDLVWDTSAPAKADVYGKVFVQNTADTASGTNTATWLQAMSQTWALPAGGVYTVIGGCSLSMKSGYTGVDLRMTVGGINNDRTNISVPSTSYTRVDGGCQADNLSGSITVAVSYKGTSGSGQTTSAQNPWALLIAQRTG